MTYLHEPVSDPPDASGAENWRPTATSDRNIFETPNNWTADQTLLADAKLIFRDGDNYIRSSADGELEFRTSGSQRMKVDSTGTTIGTLNGIVRATAGLLSAGSLTAGDLGALLASNNTWTGTNTHSNWVLMSGLNELRFRDSNTLIYSDYSGHLVIGAIDAVQFNSKVSFAPAVPLEWGVNEYVYADVGNIMLYGAGVHHRWHIAGTNEEMRLEANLLTFNNGVTDTGFKFDESAKLKLMIGATAEATLEADKWTFENGAVDTGIGWATSGQLDLTVGGNILLKVTDTVLTFGRAAANVDYDLKIDGETNDGILRFMEDEDYWKVVGNDLMLEAGQKLLVGGLTTLDITNLGTGMRFDSPAGGGYIFYIGGANKLYVLETDVSPNSDQLLDLGATFAFRDGYFGRDLKVKAGTSTTYAKAGGVLKVDTTTTGNVGVGEDTLQSYSVPANALSTNGMHLTWKASGTIATSINNKRLKAKYGATTLIDTGLVAITAAADWEMVGTIIRTSATTQEATTTIWTSSSVLVSTVDVTQPAETLSGAVTFLITGEGTANDDVVKRSFVMNWGPSA